MMALFDDVVARALIAGLGVAVIAAALGCFIVWRRMAYFGDSLAHSALLGVALGLLYGFSVNIGIVFICTVFAALLMWLQHKQILATDTLLGILAHAALSIGMIAITFLGADHGTGHGSGHGSGHGDDHGGYYESGHRDDHRDDHESRHGDDHGGYYESGHRDDHRDDHESGHKDDHRDDHESRHGDDHRDDHESRHGDDHGDGHGDGHEFLHGYLFGDILTVTEETIYWIYGGGALILLLLFLNWQSLILVTINQSLAVVEGVRATMMRLLLMFSTMLVVAVSVRIIGILLITSMLIIPAAAARQITRTPETMAVVATIIGALAMVLGLPGSVRFDTPSGPTIVVVAALLFIVALIFRRRY